MSKGAARPFVGRDSELARLLDAFENCKLARGGAVVIEGEAGIGKTRLAERFSDEVRSRGADVVWGSCREEPGAPAFWPWIQIMREIETLHGADKVRNLVGEDIRFLLPLLSATNTEAAITAIGEFSDEQLRFFLIDTACRLFSSLSLTAPLVLILDDVHAADESTLGFLRAVAARARRMRLLIICTSRIPEGRAESIAAHLHEVSRAGSRLELHGLDAESVALLLHQSGIDHSAETVRSLHSVTEGNPLFVWEMTDAVSASPPSTVGRYRAGCGRPYGSASDH